MDDTSKLLQVKAILGITDDTEDETLTTYLAMAAKEIIAWRYSYLDSWEEKYTEVPTEYENVQVMAVVEGFSIRGAEGQTTHSENGISRVFVYADMVAYIRNNVIPFVGTF